MNVESCRFESCQENFVCWVFVDEEIVEEFESQNPKDDLKKLKREYRQKYDGQNKKVETEYIEL